MNQLIRLKNALLNAGDDERTSSINNEIMILHPSRMRIL